MSGVTAGQWVLGLVAIVPTLAAAWFTYRSSSRANDATEVAARAGERKVDAEVFEKTQGLYDRAIDAARREIDRLQDQQEKAVDRVESIRDQLEAERSTSAALRGQVTALQVQVNLMSKTIEALSRQLETLSNRGLPPAPA